MLRPVAQAGVVLVLVATTAWAEVVRVDVRRRDDAGTHERIIARVHFATDPRLPANRAIVDLAHAPRNADGLVEYSGDLLFFQPKDAARARGTVFLEIVNRGRDQALGLMTGAVQRSLAPDAWSMGDGFLLDRGFTVAFLGWQFDVTARTRPHLPGARRAGGRARSRQRDHRRGEPASHRLRAAVLRVRSGATRHGGHLSPPDGRLRRDPPRRRMAFRP